MCECATVMALLLVTPPHLHQSYPAVPGQDRDSRARHLHLLPRLREAEEGVVALPRDMAAVGCVGIAEGRGLAEAGNIIDGLLHGK